ncbi:MFS transporter [Chloroflexota bacterium]
MKTKKVFYGWWIVAATFLFMIIYAGFGFFSFSLFVIPLQDTFNWGRGEIMVGLTAYYLIGGIASPFVGRLLNRYGSVRIISSGAALAGLNYVLLSFTNDLWYFYLNFALIGIGLAALGPVSCTAVVSRWFKKQRGLVLGIMSTGIGVGGLALAPLIGGYLIPNFGWSVTYIVIGIFLWVLVIPTSIFLLKAKPEDRGLSLVEKKGNNIEVSQAFSVQLSGGLTTRTALTTSALYLVAITYLVGNFSMGGTVLTQVPYFEDLGFSAAIAASTLGVLGIGSIIGKFGFGWLCDHIQAKYAWSIGLLLHVLSVILIMNMNPSSPISLLWTYSVLEGLANGAWLPTMSMLVSTNFGMKSYGTIYGVVMLALSVGVGTGPLLSGYLYDSLGNYHWVFIIFLIMCLLALGTGLGVRKPKMRD